MCILQLSELHFDFYLFIFKSKKQIFAILPPDSTLFGKKNHKIHRTLYIITDDIVSREVSIPPPLKNVPPPPCGTSPPPDFHTFRPPPLEAVVGSWFQGPKSPLYNR